MTRLSPGNYLGIGDRREYFSVPIERGLASFVDAGGGDDAIFAPYPALRASTIGNAPGSTFIGGLGNDLIQSGAGPDTIHGDLASGAGGGNDFIASSWGADVIYGGAGNDTIVADDSYFGHPVDRFGEIVGGNYYPSPDFVDGGTGDDVIWGMSGDDTLLGGDGHDLIHGNGSEDRNAPRLSVTLSLDFDGATDLASPSSFTLSEGFDRAGFREADHITGGAGNDTLFGQLGDDTLLGETGDDHLSGGRGADIIDGGTGFDFARYEEFTFIRASDDVVLAPSAGVVVRLDHQTGLGGEAEGDVIRNIEGVIGTAAADFLIGDSGDNVLVARGHEDWLFGQSGSDWLFGGGDSDQLIGGAGADWLHGGAQNDQFWFLAADFEAGVFDRVMDWGQAGDFDYLRFEGVFASPLMFIDGDGYAHITTQAVGMSGGVIVYGTTAAEAQAHLIFG
jgi:Ca2+-binding RTX toxin-like protein